MELTTQIRYLLKLIFCEIDPETNQPLNYQLQAIQKFTVAANVMPVLQTSLTSSILWPLEEQSKGLDLK